VIVTFKELALYQGRVSLVDGAFDPLHAGHIAYFQAAADCGAPLLCNVASDRYVSTKHRPLLPESQRVTVINALRDVMYVHLNERDTESVLRQLRPMAYIKGSDWKGRLPRRQVDICDSLGIRICFVETVKESSSRLLRVAGL